ncbi:MAG: tRNA (N(6)-L-threonylcarbamoyladenosine(37)-C(2))-methylthiotransferase MtaB [Dehalococcoidia bacterium]|nr:tRNA (N(6)-L-threonylcarbamoyladenosine(37)-C(2))-methylthiotransferase MtaB [Dehalococcoidia bacterium]
MKVYIETHGCKLNTADSQRISKEILLEGFTLTDNIENSDIYILNTCTVTKSADKKARNRLRFIKKNNPGIHLVATGCYPQRNESEVLSLGIVDTIISNDKKNQLPVILSEKFSKNIPLIVEPKIEDILIGRTRASIAIQKGCNQICSYCIVPKVRGRENSIDQDEIINQINYLVSKGCKEVVLTGTQLGTYGYDLKEMSLYKLLVNILNRTNITRLRLSSVQPHEFSDEILDLWTNKNYKNILCPHFHIPLQSGSNNVLKSMRRKYTTDQFTKIVNKIKLTIPNSSITTDIIVGFPGEEEEDHLDTKKLLIDSNISEIHVFPYSIRPGTSAFYLKDKIQTSLVTERAKEIRNISRLLKEKFLKSLIDTEQKVLWENKYRNSGYTENYSYFSLAKSENKRTNTAITKVKIESIEDNNLVGIISK